MKEHRDTQEIPSGPRLPSYHYRISQCEKYAKIYEFFVDHLSRIVLPQHCYIYFLVTA